MAVALDAISAFQSFDEPAPVSWTHTPVGTPTAVIVSLRKGLSSQVSGITYGGAAMTLLVQIPTSGNARVQMWGLASPSAGAQTVEISFTGADALVWAYSLSYTGTHSVTASCFTSPQSATGGTASASDTLTVSSQAGDLVADFIAIGTFPETDVALTPQGSQSEAAEDYDAASGNNFAASHHAGAASVGVSWDWASSTNVEDWRYIAVNIVQAAAADAFRSRIAGGFVLRGDD